LKEYADLHEKEICTPKKAFIIFEEEEGYQRACRMSCDQFCFQKINKMVINGTPIEIKPAPESSNIIWQNQFLPKNAKIFRKFVTFSVMVLFWLLQIVTIFYFNKKINEYEEEYPQRNCEDVRSNYGEEFDKFAII